MRNRTRTIAVFILTAAAAWTGAAAYITGFTVTPSEPACDEEVILAVQGWFPDLCYHVTGHEVVTVGNDLWLVVHVVDMWPLACGLAILEYSVLEFLEPLEPGFYTALAWEDVTSQRIPDGDTVWIPFLACCENPPEEVNDLRLQVIHGGQGLRFTWTDTPWSEAYHLYSDVLPYGIFSEPAGTATTGVTGIDFPLPEDTTYFLLASSNGCGEGPKH
jgi:hypothetical protein